MEKLNNQYYLIKLNLFYHYNHYILIIIINIINIINIIIIIIIIIIINNNDIPNSSNPSQE